ncbi:hypothetical protein LguiB_016947 [Lonicera macranthoides]
MHQFSRASTFTERNPAPNQTPLSELLNMPQPPSSSLTIFRSHSATTSRYSRGPSHSYSLPSNNSNNSFRFDNVNASNINNNNNVRNQNHQALPRSLSSCMPTEQQRQPMLMMLGDVVKINDIVGNGISGILYKWVNYGRGWRPRWFVLEDSVLSYYKIHGPDKIILTQQIEKCSKIIGQQSRRQIRRKTNKIAQSQPLRFKPFGEIHLKISSIRESGSDDKRFTINTGTKRLHLRAETREDRKVWMEALQAVKDMFPRLSNSEQLIVSQSRGDNAMVVSTDKLRHRLLEEGLREVAITDSEHIMRTEFSALYNHILLLKQKQLLLTETMNQLEAEKVDLETTVVNESQKQAKDLEASSRLRQDKCSGRSSCGFVDDNDQYDVPEEETDADDDDDDDNDNEFFDTRDFLSSSSFKSNESDIERSSTDSKDEESLDLRDGIDSCIRSVGTDYPYIKRRKKLPDPIEKEKGISLWSIIKNNIGKDLTKVCLPVYFNEPLSSLQKCFEDLEYSYLLDRAYEWGKMGNSLMRILNVAAFAVSGYASTDGRNCKPFNPLLGETYEADYPDKGVRFISEKVSHHPMIVACHCEGRGWKFWADSNLKSKFWGRSIQLDPVGVLTLEFDDGEIFQWSKATTSIYNLILGKVYCDHNGTMNIQGHGDYSCKLKFKEHSVIDRNPHQVQGVVQDQKGKTVAIVMGKWDESMHYVIGDEFSKKGKSFDSSEAHLLWKRSKPSAFQTRYNLTRFSITLNELTPGLKEKLPPTDSRLRPDQRCLENGEYQMANSEKLRLEQRQRQASKLQEKGWKPRWFAKSNDSDAYHYIGGYWEARENCSWEACPDIFGHISDDHTL